MKRSAALAPLSRDHQHALYAALRLRRATAETAAEAVAHFQHFFEAEGRRHFEIEEQLILPALPADDPDWSPAVQRVHDDHAAIRAAAPGLSRAKLEAVHALGERLDNHVRFEERCLFAMLERRLPPAALDDLGAAVADAEG